MAMWPGNEQKNSIFVAGCEFAGVDGYGGFFAAADQFGVGNNARIIGFNKIVVHAGSATFFIHGIHVFGFGNHDVVTHGRFGHFADVFQGDGEGFAGFADVDVGGVEFMASSEDTTVEQASSTAAAGAASEAAGAEASAAGADAVAEAAAGAVSAAGFAGSCEQALRAIAAVEISAKYAFMKNSL